MMRLRSVNKQRKEDKSAMASNLSVAMLVSHNHPD